MCTKFRTLVLFVFVLAAWANAVNIDKCVSNEDNCKVACELIQDTAVAVTIKPVGEAECSVESITATARNLGSMESPIDSRSIVSVRENRGYLINTKTYRPKTYISINVSFEGGSSIVPETPFPGIPTLDTLEKSTHVSCDRISITECFLGCFESKNTFYVHLADGSDRSKACASDVTALTVVGSATGKIYAGGFTRIKKNNWYSADLKAIIDVQKPVLTVGFNSFDVPSLTRRLHLDPGGSNFETKTCVARDAVCSDTYGSMRMSPVDPIVGEIVNFKLAKGAGIVDFAIEGSWSGALGKPFDFTLLDDGSYNLVYNYSGKEVSIDANFYHQRYFISSGALGGGALTGGTVTATVGKRKVTQAYEKDTVVVKVNADKGYFCRINTKSDEKIGMEMLESGYSPSVKFVMPAKGVTIYATCEPGYYDISSQVENCTLEFSDVRAKENTHVSVTPTCGGDIGGLALECSESGVTCPTLTENSGSYTFTMPASDVTVNALYNITSEGEDRCSLHLPAKAKPGAAVTFEPTCQNDFNDYVSLELYCGNSFENKCSTTNVVANNGTYSFTMPAENVKVKYSVQTKELKITMSEDVAVATSFYYFLGNYYPEAYSSDPFVYSYDVYGPTIYIKITASGSEYKRFMGYNVIYTKSDGAVDTLHYWARMDSTGVYGGKFSMQKSDVRIESVYKNDENQLYLVDASTGDHCRMNDIGMFGVTPGDTIKVDTLMTCDPGYAYHYTESSLLGGNDWGSEIYCSATYSGFDLASIWVYGCKGFLTTFVPEYKTLNDEHKVVVGSSDIFVHGYSGTILDWNSAADSVKLKAADIKEGVMIAEGKKFYAEGKYYKGDHDSSIRDTIGDKTLYPVVLPIKVVGQVENYTRKCSVSGYPLGKDSLVYIQFNLPDSLATVVDYTFRWKNKNGSYVEFSPEVETDIQYVNCDDFSSCSADHPCYSFRMPGDSVQIDVDVDWHDYSVVAEGDNRCHLELPATAKYGDVVTIEPVCNEDCNYVSLDLYCGESDGGRCQATSLVKRNGIYSFTMPAKNVKVKYSVHTIEFKLTMSEDVAVATSFYYFLGNYYPGTYSSDPFDYSYDVYGPTIYIKITAPDSLYKRFLGYNVVYTGEDGSADTTHYWGKMDSTGTYTGSFTMPMSDARIESMYKNDENQLYLVDASTGHCSMGGDGLFAVNQGDTVDVDDLIHCDSGYTYHYVGSYRNDLADWGGEIYCSATYSGFDLASIWVYGCKGFLTTFVPEYKTLNDEHKVVVASSDLFVNGYSVLSLDWKTDADSVYLSQSKFEGSGVSIASGKQFCSAEGKCYSGEVSRDTLKAVIGKTLYPATGVKVAMINSKKVATLPDDDGELMVSGNVTVDSVVMSREYKEGVFSSVMLPFGIARDNVSGAGFYQFTGVKHKEDGRWVFAVKSKFGDKIEANQPYIVMPTAKQMEFSGSVKLNTEKNYEPQVEGNWKFYGVYQYKAWPAGSSEIGYAYGIAGEDNASKGIKAGDFVKVGAGASIAPTRAYLIYQKAASALARPAAPGESSYASNPSVIDVMNIEVEDEFEEGTEKPLVIGTFNVRTGEIKTADDRWFDMKGRILNAKPTQKGTYFHKGKQVIIK